jgi:hypothetical protein
MYLTSSNVWSDQFTINNPVGYSADYLEYGLTVTGVRDNYTIKTGTNKPQTLDSAQPKIAQAFQIPWEYGVFYGAEFRIDITGGTLGADELELIVVKADGSGLPNMTDVRAVEIAGPYNSSNPVSSGSIVYYDFLDVSLSSEVVLEQGKYFIVANLTVIDDNNDEFECIGAQGTVTDYENYLYDGATWNLNDETWNLKVDVKPSLDDGSDRIFSDLSEIDLEDGAIQILSSNQEILSTGIHTLSSGEAASIASRTSLYLEMNNTYTFSTVLTAISTYDVTNSSHLSESVNWNLTWDSGLVDFTPYTNSIRVFVLSAPTDWNNQSFNLMMNGFVPFSGEYTVPSYSFDVSSFVTGSNFSDNSFSFTSTSLNYLSDFTLDSNRYNLGYWTTNGTHSIGNNGSIVTADVYVKDLSLVDVLDGDLNFTLYDPNGNIVPMKNESDYINISFLDVTSYTILEPTQFSAGRYVVNAVFDPSINGTDIEGDWTAVGVWQNGTEVGFHSLTIEVSKSTSAEFEWEENYGLADFTNSTMSINRINQEAIAVQVLYNNISDPFLIGDGTPITAAPVEYNTSWGTNGLLNFDGPNYEGVIDIDVLAGNHSITLTAAGPSLEKHSITFSVYVYHTFTITPTDGGNFNAYYNDDESTIQFYVEDTSNSSASVLPDTYAFYLGTSLLSDVLQYNVREFVGTNLIQLELYSDEAGLNLLPGFYSISISVAKQDFIVNYSQANASVTVNLEIVTTPTSIVIVDSDDEVFHGNETTITFNYYDTIHSENLIGATFDITLDLSSDKAEIIGTPTENMGLYSVTIRIFEPTETSINIFLTISKTGYQNYTNYLLKTISITPPDGGIPIYIFIIIAISSLAAILTPTIILLRRRVDQSKRAEKTLFARIYGLYESVLSITKLIIVHRATGLPVYEMDLGSEISLDPSLITGFLTAISSMGVELRGDRAGAVKRLQYKNFYVTGSESGQFTLYTFSETELNAEIENKLTVISDWFAKMFSNITEDWDGSTEIFRINLQGITEKIMKEIHLWIFYPFTVSPYKASIVEEFTGMKKKLIEYITSGDNITISRIFDELDEIRIEKGLPIIFEFIEEGILTPVFDAYKIATVRF